MWFSLDEFQIRVLRVLNFAPTQLYPNSWVVVQASLCKFLHMKASRQVFLHFYSTRPSKRAGWLSLISLAQATFLALFSSSYKNVNCGFFKVLVEKDGRKYFYDGDKPKFPFYWTKTPLKYNSWPRSLMTVDDLETLSVLNELPRKLSNRSLLRGFLSPQVEDDFFGIFSFRLYVFLLMSF